MLKTSEPFDGYFTVPKLLERNAREFSNSPAYREKEYGIWQTWNWKQSEEEITALANGLISMGLEVGDKVAIIGRNRPALYWSFIAAQMVGAIPVPIYNDAVGDEIAYVLEHCGANFAIVGDQEQCDKLHDIKEKLPELTEVIYLDPRGLRKYDHSHLHSYKKVQNVGREVANSQSVVLQKRLATQNQDTICVMLYTSGTTGKPKGVVLTYKNVLSASRAASSFDNLKVTDEILAYLPMAWVGDFIFANGQALWVGFCVNCPESPETMQGDLKEIGPTYFFSPPRIFEEMLTTITIRMEDVGRLKKSTFDYFMRHAKKVGNDILDGKNVQLWDRIKYSVGEFIIYKPLKNSLGLSRVRIGYTAGEAIGPEIFDFYRSLGINLKQLYGQTEAGVFVTLQPDGEVRADTVGIPCPGVELKISESGEVFYRSDSSFHSYYKNPEGTAETKDKEGWVATGDAGFIEEDSGHLRIIDRAKDVGKMADGSLFAPKFVENKLKFYPNILEAVLFGNGRDNCCAFINIDLNAVGNWAERNNISYSSYQELSGHPDVVKQIQEHIEEVNISLASDEMLSGCQIHRFLILHKELDADDGEMTRTRKVRRRIVEDKYSDLIQGLYSDKTQISTNTEVTYEDGRKGSISADIELRNVTTVNEKVDAA